MTEPSQDVAILRGLPFFAEMSAESATAILGAARGYELGPGSILWRPGEPPEFLHVLLDGYVAVTAADDHANDYVLDFFDGDEPFIVAPIVLDLPYISTGRTLRHSRLVKLPAAVIRRCAETDTRLLMALLRVVCRQGRALVDHVRMLKTRTSIERLAAFLLSLTEGTGDVATVTLPCERRLLGGWLGIVPSSVSRGFRELAKIGVHGSGRQLTIDSVARLRRFARLPA